MSIEGIILGNELEANTHPLTKGWVVGHMHQGLAHTLDLEIKLWRYDGPIDYGKKSFGGTEFIVIYGGCLRFQFEQVLEGKTEQDEIVLNGEGHEYVIFPPGITKTVIVESAPAFGVTVRSPSNPGINQVLSK